MSFYTGFYVEIMLSLWSTKALCLPPRVAQGQLPRTGSGAGPAGRGRSALTTSLLPRSPCSWPSASRPGQVNLTHVCTSVVWCSDVVVNMPPSLEFTFLSFSRCVCLCNQRLIPRQGGDASASRGPPARPPRSTRAHILRQLRPDRPSATARRPAPHSASAPDGAPDKPHIPHRRVCPCGIK